MFMVLLLALRCPGEVMPVAEVSDIVLKLILSPLIFFQFDWCAWVPNTPCTMRRPPPTDKDGVTMEMIMATLPDISQSCVQMAITWHLGRAQPDAVSPPLPGSYSVKLCIKQGQF